MSTYFDNSSEKTMHIDELKKHIQQHIKFSDNISLLENVDQLALDKIPNGILIIWVTWSPGFHNCVNAIKLLQDKNYPGQIIIIENESIPTDFQKKIFGRVALHGWGEIFVIKDGLIVKEFTGKESSSNFRIEQDKFLSI